MQISGLKSLATFRMGTAAAAPRPTPAPASQDSIERSKQQVSDLTLYTQAAQLTRVAAQAAGISLLA